MDRRKRSSRAAFTPSETLLAVMFRPADRRTRQNRAAYTLIEILIVVVIIGILIALLIPAVAAAVRKAREAQVTAEMNNLATALASFKNLNGDYPPSRVLLCEYGYANFQTQSSAILGNPVGPITSDGLDTDISFATLMNRSQIYLTRFWPRVDFVISANAITFNGTYLDFNGNGQPDAGYVVLSGSECLAFFLGGLPVNNQNGTFSMSGFSKSPVNPFQNSQIATNRSVPQYEFVSGRLIDQDGDHFPSYIDPINTVAGNRRSYAYFSSYGANAYDPNDVNGYGRASDGTGNVNDAGDFEHDDDSADLVAIDGTYTQWGFLVGYALSTGTSGQAVSPSPNPYTAGPSSSGNVSWINPTTFQIICSGQDGYFGLGGTYTGTSTNNPLPILPLTSDVGNVHNILTRIRENDNLTNFSAGRLN